ncbi:hypothetical protein AKJ16_DCAP25919, partial [Drosera capensis]
SLPHSPPFSPPNTHASSSRRHHPQNKHHPKPSLLKENKSVSDDNGASRAWILWSRADASRGGLALPQIHQIETVELGGLRSSVSLVGLAPQVRWSTDLEWVDEIYLLDPGVLVLVLDRQDETDRCLPVFLPRPRCPSSYGLRRWISPALIPNDQLGVSTSESYYKLAWIEDNFTLNKRVLLGSLASFFVENYGRRIRVRDQI